METIILITALLPVAVLVFYIWRKDRQAPEPVWQLVKAFGLGVLSVPISLSISLPLGLLGLYSDTPVTLFGSFCTSFFGAAIPEEAAKLFVLWLLLRRNKHFDQKMDGIVYAVMVSMGFAALENVMYLFGNENWLTVGVTRALFSVPGHFCFGVLMGYYYSLAKFYPGTPRKNKLMVYFAPVIVHGIFDTILFSIDVAPLLGNILVLGFLAFCPLMWKYASKRIKEHLARDADDSVLENCNAE